MYKLSLVTPFVVLIKYSEMESVFAKSNTISSMVYAVDVNLIKCTTVICKCVNPNVPSIKSIQEPSKVVSVLMTIIEWMESVRNATLAFSMTLESNNVPKIVKLENNIPYLYIDVSVQMDTTLSLADVTLVKLDISIIKYHLVVFPSSIVPSLNIKSMESVEIALLIMSIIKHNKPVSILFQDVAGMR